MCKYWKMNGFAIESKGGEKFSDHRRRKLADEQKRDALDRMKTML